jgi:hypothetical protein
MSSATGVSPVCRQHNSCAVERQKLQPVGPLGAEHEDVATVWVGLQSLGDQRHGTVDAGAKIDRLRRHENPDLRAKRDHRAALNATITFVRVRASAPNGTRTVAPAIATSMLQTIN